jgi:hypothetical protein
MSTARTMGDGVSSQDRVVARCMFTTRQLTTFVIGHSEFDTMVNDYGGGDRLVLSGYHFSS